VDLIRELGAVAFASRLRRLSDRLKSEATKIYQSQGIEFNDSWFLVALVLSRRDGVSVTEAAETLGFTHAAISQMAAAMKKRGLIDGRPDERDGRKTLLYLTDEGREMVDVLQPIWAAVGTCTDELISETGADLLSAMTEMENRLDRSDLVTRVSRHLEKQDG
jgi:DNA-binding MarR family transcriptional regulator